MISVNVFLKSVLIGCLCCISLSAICQNEMTWEDRPFQDGEELIYCIYYNWKFVWIPAGEVKFKIKETDDEIFFHITGRSYPSYDSFFKVRDDYISRVDKNSFLPSVFRRDVLEGNYQRFDSISFDQKNLKLIEYFGRTRATAKLHHFEIEQEVQDMISAIYELRSQDISTSKKGKTIALNIFFDKEHFSVNVRMLGQEKKRIKGIGKIEAIHLQPELIDGYVFKEGDLMDIWVSNDENKIPLQIESPITFGSVKAILTSVKNSKYPFPYFDKMAEN